MQFSITELFLIVSYIFQSSPPPPQRALHEAGNHVVSICGARNKELVFWEDKMKGEQQLRRLDMKNSSSCFLVSLIVG